MIEFFVKKLLLKKINAVIVIAIILCRLQQITLYIDSSYPFAVSIYSNMMSFPFISLILPTLYCGWIFDNCTLFNDTKFVLRVKSRFSLSLAYVECAILDAFFFTLILTVTAVLAVIYKGGNIAPYFSYLTTNCLLQFLYLLVCSFLYFFIYLLSTKAPLAFLIVIFYGVYDYGSTYVMSFANKILIGATYSAVSYNTFKKSPNVPYTDVSFLLSLIIALFVFCVICCLKKDFIGKNEVKGYE